MGGIGLGIGPSRRRGSSVWAPSTSGQMFFMHADDMSAAAAIPGGQAAFVPQIPDNSANLRTLMAASNTTTPLYSATGLSSLGALTFPTAQTARPYDQAGDAITYWKRLHDGTGLTILAHVRAVGTGTKHVVLSSTNSTTGAGIVLYHDGTNGKWCFELRNASTAILSLAGANGSSPTGANYVVAVTYIEGASPECVLRVNGVQVASGNTTGTPAATTNDVLCLGRYKATTSYWEGGIRSVAIYSRVMGAAELAEHETNIATLTSARPVRRIWTVGDSITAVTLWQQQFWKRSLLKSAMQVDFLGTRLSGDIAGFCERQMNAVVGYTIAQLITETNGTVLGAEPTDICVMIGTNNAGADLTATMASYDTLIQQLKTQHPTSRIWILRSPRNLSTGAKTTWTVSYTALLVSYAAANNCTYVDCDVNLDAEISGDGIHPVAAGYVVIGDKVATAFGL